MSADNETYIGDGVYVSWDGVQIKLRAPRPFGDSEVFLEEQLWGNLLEFAKNKKIFQKSE